MSAEKCPVNVSDSARGWHPFPCNRPIKRDGMCGIHAAAVDRRQANATARAERTKARDAALAMANVHAREIGQILGVPIWVGYGAAGDGSDVEFCIKASDWLNRKGDR